jgi:hypothetical protein
MQRLLFTALACLLSFSVFGQDVLITNEGEEILVRVIEVSHDDIKYKKYSNLEGPIYAMFKSDIFMIKYENGELDVFKDTEINNTSDKDEPREKYQGKRTAAFLEVGGACAIGSVNLNVMFINTRVFRLGFRAGLGFTSSTVYNGLPVDSMNVAIGSSVYGLGIPLHLTSLLGYGSHFYEVGFGITLLADANMHLHTNAGYRFQPDNKNYLLRVNLNYEYDIVDEDFFFLPGISYGIRF